MSKKSSGSKIKFATFKVQLAALLGGIFVAEIYYLLHFVSYRFVKWASSLLAQCQWWSVSLLYLAISVLVVTYFWARGGIAEMKRFLLSWRIDVFLSFGSGVVAIVYLGGIGKMYYRNWSKHVEPSFILVFIGLMLFLALMSLMHICIKANRKPPGGTSLFISDAEIESPEDDLLGLSKQAKLFAERLYNGGSRESIVFGIDAPWGIGKSSFLNFCLDYLNKTHKGEIIVYRFDPLKHEDPSILQEKFIGGLVKAIQSSVYLPEISSLMSRYSRILKGKVGFRMFGLTFEANSYSVEETFEDLEDALGALNKKVLILIDDLDRLDFSIVKDILFSIKKSFALPNLSYILCYDTENIANLEDAPDDKEKVREFLEKFVNVKLSLFISSSALSGFVSDNFSKVLANNKQIDPVATQKLLNAVAGIEEIYSSNKYYEYRSFLNDVRKLKRLVNLMISLDIESTDFANSDIDRLDLIHLLLIYINYPNVFRRIYDSEMGEARGFFSLVGKYEEGYPSDQQGGGRYANSTFYAKYLTTVSEGQKFLLNKVFDATTRFDVLSNAEPDDLARHTYACFNGTGGGKNLQRYLNLISNLSKPPKSNQYTFYVRMVDLFKGGGDFSDIFKEERFEAGEKEIQEFWKILVNGSRDLSLERAENAVSYLLASLPSHSYVVMAKAGIGIRARLSSYLAVMLDRAGWIGSNLGRVDNLDENVIGIANWIFGDKGKVSILERLMDEGRDVLGIYDVLLFRLQCSADRDSSLFNLTRALALHSKPPAPTTGDIKTVAIGSLREMSQKIYGRFREGYILPRRNFLRIVDELDLSALAGNYASKIVELSIRQEGREKTLDVAMQEAKSLIKAFCVYQLGNAMVSSGVGCGYYDEDGVRDNAGIKQSMSRYLFETCFAESGSNSGFVCFLDYLLLCFDMTFEVNVEGRVFEFHPTLDQFLRVLDREQLFNYWSANRAEILAAKFEEVNKPVYNSNYHTSYADGLPQVYKILDELIGLAVVES